MYKSESAIALSTQPEVYRSENRLIAQNAVCKLIICLQRQACIILVLRNHNMYSVPKYVMTMQCNHYFCIACFRRYLMQLRLVMSHRLQL